MENPQAQQRQTNGRRSRGAGQEGYTFSKRVGGIKVRIKTGRGTKLQ